ncbi:hypothetical protein CC80DRAFT_583733, partial [Byssothecium circinans]
MDPATAVSLVAGIIQFVDLGGKIFKGVREVRQSSSGVTEDTRRTTDVVTEMRNLACKLENPGGGARNDNERALQKLAAECRLEQKLAGCRSQLGVHIKRLISLTKSSRFQSDIVADLQEQFQILQQGVHISTIGAEVQQQLKSLFELPAYVRTAFLQQSFLRGLEFADMRTRYEVVDEAHFKTFRWVLEDNPNAQPSAVRSARETFIRWLSTGDGAFHIIGKIGSGKSTLMKFLSTHSRVQEELQMWAGKRKLVLANFFFWKPGSTLQKSAKGLLRSLLHDVLREAPELTSSLFPTEWEIEYGKPSKRHCLDSSQSFSDSAIRNAFSILLKQKSIYETHRFCFFLDALDEYEGPPHEDHTDMIRLLNSWLLTSRGGVKIRVSSREYAVFEGAFDLEKRFRLQDLTSGDRERYVQERLHGIPDKIERERLVRDVVGRSDGVFLWTVLVVKALRECIGNGQGPKAIEQELSSYPTELDELFVKLLSSIRLSAKRMAFQIFAMIEDMTARKTTLPLLSCLFLDNYNDNPKFA